MKIGLLLEEDEVLEFQVTTRNTRKPVTIKITPDYELEFKSFDHNGEFIESGSIGIVADEE